MEQRKEVANPIIFFNGDVHADELKKFVETISKDSKSDVDIVIGGSLILDTDEEKPNSTVKFPVNLWVLDEIVITSYSYARLMVDGDLYCTGKTDSMEIVVARDFVCDHDIDSTGVEAGGDAMCKGNIDTNWGCFKTLGDFTCYGNCKSDVLVGGFFLCEGEFTGNVTKI